MDAVRDDAAGGGRGECGEIPPFVGGEADQACGTAQDGFFDEPHVDRLLQAFEGESFGRKHTVLMVEERNVVAPCDPCSDQSRIDEGNLGMDDIQLWRQYFEASAHRWRIEKTYGLWLRKKGRQ
jgi:hypothetical protein